MGRWMMKSEELDANTVTFAVGLDGALVFPGQVFAIQDELRAANAFVWTYQQFYDNHDCCGSVHHFA